MLAALVFAAGCAGEGDEGPGLDDTGTSGGTGETAPTGADETGDTGGTNGAVECHDFGTVPEDQAAEVLAEALCSQWTTCGCDLSDLGDPMQCRATVEASFEQLRSEQAGLTYAPQCMARHIAVRTEILGCKYGQQLHRDDITWLGHDACAVWHGDLPVGAACTSTSTGMSDPCELGAHCHMGECQPAPGRLCLGDACEDRLDAGCQPGAYCDAEPGESGTCQPHLSAGDQCDSNLECAPDLPCWSSTFECAPYPASGEPCLGGACGADDYCTAGTCTPLPTIGQPCVEQSGQGTCAPGAICNADTDACEANEAVVCDERVRWD